MKIFTKLILWFCAVIVIIGLSILLYSQNKAYVLEKLRQDEIMEKHDLMRTVLGLKGQLLEKLAQDYTYWDEMVDFIHHPQNKVWASQNIDTSLPTFSASAVWIFDNTCALVYAADDKSHPGFSAPAVPCQVVREVFSKGPLCHFFMHLEDGTLVEIRGASVHPTADQERKTPPQGYFLAARIWDAEYLHNISSLVGGDISVSFIGAHDNASSSAGSNVQFSDELEGVDGRPVARLTAKINSGQVGNFIHAMHIEVAGFTMFALLILCVMSYFVWYVIMVPLRLLLQSLREENTARIVKLQQDSSEFGDLARLIADFFAQKKELLAQVRQHYTMENRLQESYQALRQTQQELIQSSKMSALGQLAAGVSHELNQPLTGIKGFAQAALLDLDAQNPLRADLKKIIEQADRMDKIIKNVRFFARKSEFAMDEVDINKPIQDSCALLQEQLKVRNIALKLSLPPDLPRIHGDLNQLQQVFVNLVSNAWDAIEGKRAKEGGMISIATRLLPEKRAIEITVADNGTGIPEEFLEHIFIPFFTTKSPDGGMGLGLAIVYRIIENHRGSITLESAAGRGTKFIIHLPVVLDTLHDAAV